MSGETKRIDPKKITNIKASFNASESAIPDNVQNEMLDAPARENFEKATASVKTAMTNLTDTVQSLDQYLDAVAVAFQNADEKIASGIGDGNQTNGNRIYKKTPKEPAHQVPKKNIKDSKYYNDLPGVQ